MRTSFLIPLFLLAAQLAASPALGKPIMPVEPRNTYGATGCNFKCQECVWNFPSGGPDRCVPNVWGVLTCQPSGSAMARSCNYRRAH
jgi:hypothetical protein